MNDNIANFNYLKDTVSKFKEEIQKMISSPNYSTAGVIQLKQTVDEIEKNISNQEKVLVTNYLNQKKAVAGNHKMLYEKSPLPMINQPQPKIISYAPEEEVYTTMRYAKQSTLDRLKEHRNQREINEEKMQYIANMKKRRKKGKFQEQSDFRIKQFKNNKTTAKLLAKFNINSDFYDSLKVTTKRPNFMDTEKRLKYSVLSKKFNQNEILYDKNKQPIIRKEELDKGLLNMIYKGLIPKGADLSPALETNGNPLQINMRIKEDLAKTDAKDEYEISPISNIKIDLNNNDGFFITKQPNEMDNSSNNNNLLYKITNEKEEEKNASSTNNNNLIDNPITISTNKKKVLMFSNYSVVKNEEYKQFYNDNQDKWGGILYLFEHLSKLFRRLNLTLVEVYQEKIANLAKDEMRVIQNKDLLMCISDKDLILKGLDPSNPIQFYSTIKEKFVVKIQMAFRTYKAKKKLKEIKSYFKKIRKIQNAYLSSKLIVQSRMKAKNIFEEKYNNWTSMMKKFKSRWELIKSMPRVEIHFNNISPNTPNFLYLNSTMHKFQEKENNQLNRIINLFDPNVEIIYISPCELSPDILSYYFSIMATLGVERIKERFHVLVPDQVNVYPPHFSISQLLLLSSGTLTELKKLIQDKEAYIVPGNGGKIEVELSMFLEIPILMGDLFQTETIFTKSGAKLIFEANEINVPVSAWDIKTEFEFFASLAHLIITYPEYETWIFKMDNESNGRGIAYIQLDRIQQYLDLKKEYFRYDDKKKYEVLVGECLQKNISKKVKIIANLLYKSWEDYLQEFISNRGVIEACPTTNPSNIIGSPSIPILIEPDGSIEHLPTYDKINIFSFRNIGAISPQRSFPSANDSEVNLDLIADKIGKYLYEHDIIGYVTIELISYRNANSIRYLAIDLKFGLNDLISSIRFCHFLYAHAMDRLQPDLGNISLNQERSLSMIQNNKCDIFTFPFFAHTKISEIKIGDLVKSFRDDNLIFDLEKKKGIIFNFSDTLQCGNMGICGIVNNEDVEIKNVLLELWKMIQNSFQIVSMAIRINDFQPMIVTESRTDVIDAEEIIAKVNKFTNNLIMQNKKIDNNRNNNSVSFLNKI